MSSVEDLQQQANTVAERLRRTRSAVRSGAAPDAHELATLEARLSGLWAAIRQARAGGDSPPPAGAETRTRPKWDGPLPRRRPQ